MPKDFKLFEIPVDKSQKHPPCANPVLPYHEFTMGIIAPKGSGKTTLICNILHQYKNYFHKIIVFSPTVKNDDKWDWVKEQKLLAKNEALYKWLKKKNEQDVFSKSSEIVERAKQEYAENIEKFCPNHHNFDATLPEECFIHDYDSSTLVDILSQQKELIDYLKDNGQSKYLADRMLLIFDDLVGSSLFSSARKNPFKVLNTTHRHYSASIMMVTQAYMEIPKTIRTNYSCMIVFEIFSDKELAAIMEEYPMGLKPPQWLEVYNYCVGKDYGFLYYNMQRKEKSKRIMDCFTQVLFYT